MTKQLFKLVIISVLGFMLTSCKFIRVSGGAVENAHQETPAGNVQVMGDRELPVGDFHSLLVNGYFDIDYASGETGMQVIGPERLMEDLRIDNTDGLLTIELSNKNRGRRIKETLTILLSSPVLENVEIRGAADFKARDIRSQDFVMNLKGAGDLTISSLKSDTAMIIIEGAGDCGISNVDCGELTVEIRGAGDCEIGGYAERTRAVIRGVGDIDLRGLRTNEYSSDVRGVGDIRHPSLRN